MNRDASKIRNGVIAEIFSSVQGEGPHVGTRQIFLRLQGCSRSCQYCDTPGSRAFERAEGLREEAPGRGGGVPFPNPVGVDRVVDWVAGLAGSPLIPPTVAVTGGEPLEQPEFLSGLLPRLQDIGFSTYLETNGDCRDALEKVIASVDVVAQDLKLPSVSGEGLDWDNARAFLAVACRADLFVKIVVSAGTDESELDRAFDLVAREAPAVPVILQPVSPPGTAPGPGLLLAWQARGLARIKNVRIIPQIHKSMGIQ